jgi:2-hydroxychromene-2-carboxylate isomerase
VQPRDLSQPGEVATALAPLGLAAEDFMALVADGDVKAALIANTDEAVARGVFGAPSIFVGDELFFGQDRMDFVRRALQ